KRERTFALVSAHIAETLPCQRAAPGPGSEARQRTTAGAVGRPVRERTSRLGVARSSERGPVVRTPLGFDAHGTSARETKRRIQFRGKCEVIRSAETVAA